MLASAKRRGPTQEHNAVSRCLSQPPHHGTRRQAPTSMWPRMPFARSRPPRSRTAALPTRHHALDDARQTAPRACRGDGVRACAGGPGAAAVAQCPPRLARQRGGVGGVHPAQARGHGHEAVRRHDLPRAVPGDARAVGGRGAGRRGPGGARAADAGADAARGPQAPRRVRREQGRLDRGRVSRKVRQNGRGGRARGDCRR